MIEASSDPVEFREAVEWFANKLALTKDEWEQLTLEARRKAFTVANVAQAELVSGVKDSLKRAIEEGQSFGTWKKQIGPALEEAWGGERPWQLETIFRTNVQSAYGAGRYAQLTDPDVLDARPYWMFDAIMDGATTAMCAALHGTVLRADDKWWDGRIPPLHFNCRSSLRSLDEEQAKEQPKFAQPKPSQRGSDGFGWTPDKSEWEPDLEKYEEQVRRELKMRLAHGPDGSKLPRREAPVAITGPQVGPDASRGNQWAPGSVRSDQMAPGIATRVGQPPWIIDEELRPATKATLHKGAQKPEEHEEVIDGLLSNQGNLIEILPQSGKYGRKQPDRLINGIVTELTHVSDKSQPAGRRATIGTLANRISAKAKDRQARYLVVDCRDSSIRGEEVVDLMRNRVNTHGKAFAYIRVIGRDFDMTFGEFYS